MRFSFHYPAPHWYIMAMKSEWEIISGSTTGMVSEHLCNGTVAKTADFSSAPKEKLYLPCVETPEFHYSKLSVAASEENPDSLLHWMRKLSDCEKDYWF